MTPRTQRLHEADNVVIAIDAMPAKPVLSSGLAVTERVPKGHH